MTKIWRQLELRTKFILALGAGISIIALVAWQAELLYVDFKAESAMASTVDVTPPVDEKALFWQETRERAAGWRGLMESSEEAIHQGFPLKH